MLTKELLIGEFAVGQHLLPALALDLRIELARQFSGIVPRHDPHPAARGQIDEGSGHLAPVAELERPLAQAATGHQPYRIRGATVDLDKRNQPLAIRTIRVADSQPFQPQ